MNSILNFDELLRHLSEQKVVKRLAVVWPEDDARVAQWPAHCRLVS